MRKLNLLLWITIGCMALSVSGCKDKKAVMSHTDRENRNELLEEAEFETETETEFREEHVSEEEVLDTSYQVRTDTTYEVMEWDPELEMNLVTAYYDKIILSEEAPASLKAVVDKLNDENRTSVVNDSDGLFADAKEFSQYTDYVSTWEQSNSVYVKRADEHIFSVKTDAYRYFGGAHPTNTTITHTYDVNTGKELSINEIVLTYDKFYEIVLGKLKEINESEEYLNGYYENYEEVAYDYFYGEYKKFLSWTLDSTGLSIYFDSYVLGPYARGNTVLDFSFEEYKDIFYPQYFSGDVKYAQQVEMYQPICIDVNHDGEKDTITVMNMLYEEDFYTDYSIYYNDKNLDVSMFGEPTDAYLAEGEDGEYYLYLENIEMNDYHYVSVFRFADGNIENVGEPMEAFYGWHMLNPEKFIMARKIDLLGSYRGSRYFCVGEGGMPVPFDEEYILDSEWIEGIVSTKELPALLLNNDGIYEESTLPAGTKYIPYATDGSTYMKFTLTTGVKGMLQIEQEDYVNYIGGISEYDCFEMLPYAG